MYLNAITIIIIMLFFDGNFVDGGFSIMYYDFQRKCGVVLFIIYIRCARRLRVCESAEKREFLIRNFPNDLI